MNEKFLKKKKNFTRPNYTHNPPIAASKNSQTMYTMYVLENDFNKPKMVEKNNPRMNSVRRPYLHGKIFVKFDIYCFRTDITCRIEFPKQE